MIDSAIGHLHQCGELLVLQLNCGCCSTKQIIN